MFGYYPIKYNTQGIKKPDYSDSHTHHHKHHHKKHNDINSDQNNQEFGQHGAEDYAKILGEGQAAQDYVNKKHNNKSLEMEFSVNANSNTNTNTNSNSSTQTGKAGIPGCGKASNLDYPHSGYHQHSDHHNVGMFPEECPGKDLLHMGHDKVGIPGCGQSGNQQSNLGNQQSNLVGSKTNSRTGPIKTADAQFGAQLKDNSGAGRMGDTSDVHDYSKGHKGEFISARMNEQNIPMGADDTTDRSFGPQTKNVPGAGRMEDDKRQNIGSGHHGSGHHESGHHTSGIHDYSKGTKGEFTGAKMNEKNVPMGSEDTTDRSFGPQATNIPGAGRMDDDKRQNKGSGHHDSGHHDYSKGNKGEFIGARMNEKNAPPRAENTNDSGFGPQTMNSIPGAGRMGNTAHGNVLLGSTHPNVEHGQSHDQSYNTDSGRKISVGSFEDKHDGEHAFEDVSQRNMHHDVVSDMPHQQKYNFARAEAVPRSEQTKDNDTKDNTKNEESGKKESLLKKVERTLFSD
ncbi:hypothetical protein RNJ44_04325 [Nakaseomyces bracarensis]|uniref:Dehydrin n=1 Tax=Nakaseomyces bracarensis TaxID=273131 RepID=A0ABR4NUL3_9SACH